MKIIKNFDIDEKKGSVITIGNFDGLHLGHKKLIRKAKEIALEKDLVSIVLSFDPHPLAFFNKEKEFFYILSQEEKIRELEQENIDIFLNYSFDLAFASLTPSDFIDYLINKLNCQVLVVGEDYCFGKNRSGDISTLIEIGGEKNLEVVKVSNVNLDAERVSSTKIKEFILNKNIKKASMLLNKHYYIFGEVVEGNKIGRTIGFPTANIIPKKGKLLPPDGVYATKTKYKGNIYQSITNIGKNPTIKDEDGIRTVETFIFDFNQNLYGEKIQILFLEWIRDVKKFSCIEELKENIAKDIVIATKYFTNDYL